LTPGGVTLDVSLEFGVKISVAGLGLTRRMSRQRLVENRLILIPP